jgi:putative tryptophan/tyrosine transport system substrate-binding protein
MTARRGFLQALVGTQLLVLLDAAAQRTAKVHRIGFLWDTPNVWPHALEGFRQGLRDLGWIDGKNIIVEYRWLEGHFERLPAMAEELVRLKADVIVAPTSIYTEAARRATTSIPIVFASHADPVGSGHVANLAQPGTNATGLTIVMSATMPKSLELLKSAIPHLLRVAVLWDPATPSHKPGLAAVHAAGRTLGLQVQALEVTDASQFERAFDAISRERAEGALVLSTPLFIGSAKQLADLGLRHRIATMFGSREHVDAGGLLSYSPDRADLYRRAAAYVDKILKGADPAKLPVQQATKFELAINLKTAAAIGLKIPKSLLVRADHIVR